MRGEPFSFQMVQNLDDPPTFSYCGARHVSQNKTNIQRTFNKRTFKFKAKTTRKTLCPSLLDRFLLPAELGAHHGIAVAELRRFHWSAGYLYRYRLTDKQFELS